MKKGFKNTISVLLSIVFIFTATLFPVNTVFSLTASENAEINRLEQQVKDKEAEVKKLKQQNAEQSKIKAALDSQISSVNAQIELCNRKINEFNSKIAANDAEIKATNDKIDASKTAFKKRIRAIYMSGGTGSGIEVLLGAETFADYIALSQLTLNVSKRDKKMVEDMFNLIKEIEEKTEENKKLIESQNEIKATLKAKEAELDEKVGAVNSVIKDLNSSTKQMEKQIKAWKDEINSIMAPSSADSGVFADGIFGWPVPSCTRINSGFGSRWGSWHKGIDISQSGIKDKPIVAAADGVVTTARNGCSHNYGKSYSCGCGGGYGNYVVIAHGQYQGASYRTLYAHMSRPTVSVGQTVKKGQVIGYVGSTGWSTGWHLHYEILKNGVNVNPENYYVRVK